MSAPDQPNTPESRDKARSRLRTLTRAAVFAATGATAVIGIVVAHEHPGADTRDGGTTASTSSGSGPPPRPATARSAGSARR